MAPIAVDDKGQNSIIICNGANDYLTEADVAAADDVIAKAKARWHCLGWPGLRRSVSRRLILPTPWIGLGGHYAE